MPQHDEHAPLQQLDERLRRRRAKEAEQRNRGKFDPRRGLGFAMRIGVELVAALVVGVGIGVVLDRWLGTAPWLMLVFFILGSAAGMINVYRTVTSTGHAVGYKTDTTGPDDQRPDDKTE